MNFKIYQNDLGVTVFDDYFSYIEQLHNVIPLETYDFFSDWDRYSLRSEKTLHDSRIHSFKMEANSLFIELNLKFGSQLQLIYSDPNVQFPLNLIKNLWNNDLLVHELCYLATPNRYIHALCFDNNQNLLINFKSFSFIEK